MVITDAIPANTTYVPGSIAYTAGLPIGAWTDATGDDVAEFEAGGLTMRIAMGAAETSGGTVAVGSTVAVRFSVLMDALTSPTEIANTALALLHGVGGGTGTTRIEVVSRTTAGRAEGPTKIEATPCADALVDGGFGCRIALASSSSGSRGGGLISGLAPALAVARRRRSGRRTSDHSSRAMLARRRSRSRSKPSLR